MAARRNFGVTWWGRAWTEALEQRARLDPNRLPRGRTYARHDRVHDIELGSGEITARVKGSRPTPYAVRVRIRTFTDAEWDAVLDAVTSRAAHAAALLDGELDPAVVDDARAAGVELLPVAGELTPRCSCPDWADPCKHAAAVCYLVADELDADPFALLRLRGRSREQVLAQLRSRRAAGASRAPVAATSGSSGGESDAGVRAAEAWSRRLGRLPHPPSPRPAPGNPAPWPVDPPADAPFSGAGLRALAGDAASRAWGMTRGESTSSLDLDERSDLARRAATALGTPGWQLLVAATGRPAANLSRDAIAWRHGGADGLRIVVEDPWSPSPLTLAAARDAVVATGVGVGRVRVERNRLTLPGVGAQLRLGRDGKWYRFEKRAGRWELAAPPADEPEDLVAESGL